jgi:hypothetical protein
VSTPYGLSITNTWRTYGAPSYTVSSVLLYGRYYSALSICGIYENRQAVCGNVESTLIPGQKRCISLGLQGPRNTNPLSNRPDCKRVLGRNWRNVNRANRSTTFEKADACNRKRWMVYVRASFLLGGRLPRPGAPYGWSSLISRRPGVLGTALLNRRAPHRRAQLTRALPLLTANVASKSPYTTQLPKLLIYLMQLRKVRFRNVFRAKTRSSGPLPCRYFRMVPSSKLT